MSAHVKLAIIAAFIAIFISMCGIYKVFKQVHLALNYDDRVATSVNARAFRLFNNFDEDADGYLDIFEFDAATKFLAIEEKEKGAVADESIVDANMIKDQLINSSMPTNEEYVTLIANFKPLEIKTMSKSKHDLDGIDPMADVHLRGLKAWQHPFIHKLNFSTIDLKLFLPKSPKKIGETWGIIIPITSRYEPGLSNNRINAGKPSSNSERIIQNMLTMFCPRPFVLNRFAPQGTIAVLRAVNQDYFDIVFRMHAEFQVNEPPNFPFWFTPAQFSGNVIISKNGKHVEHFEMHVPNDKKLNVDMEWITGKKKVIDQPNDEWEMEVDIGYLPEMALRSDGQSRNIGDEVKPRNKIVWDQEISQKDAKRLLQKAFYPFQEVEYFPFNKTYEKAKEENKLVHQILLWGALDDQSC